MIVETLARWYLSLAPSCAPDYWRANKPLERARMEYEDEAAGGFLRWFPRLSLADKDVLDLGCGYGGRTVRYAELGPRSVVGIEPIALHCKEAQEFARKCRVHTSFVIGSGEALPFAANSFDCIVSYDVLEHVCDPARCLEECLRVLKDGGSLHAVFPPFHHPTGSHLESWLSKMPWSNVLFPCPALVRAGEMILARRSDDYRPALLRPHDKLWGLNGITIGKLRRIVATFDADSSIKFAPLFSQMNRKWSTLNMKYYAPLFAPLCHFPVLQECFTHRVVFEMRKRGNPA